MKNGISSARIDRRSALKTGAFASAMLAGGGLVNVARAQDTEPRDVSIIVVSHGAVGCLLTAHLQKVEIGQESRPQHPGGGCFIVIDRDSFTLTQDWRSIEDGFVS